MVSKEEFELEFEYNFDCTDLDKAVACDTNVATGAQEKGKWRRKRDEIGNKNENKDQEIFKSFKGEGFETREVTKKFNHTLLQIRVQKTPWQAKRLASGKAYTLVCSHFI